MIRNTIFLFTISTFISGIPTSGAALRFRDDLCVRDNGQFLGPPITLTYDVPLTPPESAEEVLPQNGSLFPNPPGGGSQGGGGAGGGPACSGGGIVGALNCVTTQIGNAGSGGDGGAEGGTSGASTGETGAPAEEIRNGPEVFVNPEPVTPPVSVTMQLQPVFGPGNPPTVIFRPVGDAGFTRHESMTEADTARVAEVIATQGRSIAGWSQPLTPKQMENLRLGVPLQIAPPLTAPGATSDSRTGGIRLPAECTSLFRAQNDLAVLRERGGSIRDRIKFLEDRIKEEREKRGLWGSLWDSEEIDRMERILDHEKSKLAAVNRQIAEKTDFIDRREDTLDAALETARLDEIKSDPQTLEAEEQRRREALIEAARESARFKWLLIEGEQQYAQSLAAYDTLIARAEADGNDDYAEALRSDKERLERARDSWRDSYEGMYDARLRDQQRLIEENREDGIGPTQDVTSMLLAEGENPIEVLESGARAAARDSMARRVGTDTTTLGGTATEEYTFEDFARDLGDSNAEMWENPELFAERYGAYLKGAGEGVADAVKDVVILAAEAGDTAGEAFESALSDVTGHEFNTFGRENLDAIIGAADALSDADALSIGETAANLASAVDRKIEKMAGSGEAGIREALEGTGYAAATILAAEEVVLAEAIKGAKVLGAASDLVDAARAADAVTDVARASDAVTDTARAADAASDLARASDAATDIARASDAASDVARASDTVTDTARAGAAPTDAARASDAATPVPEVPRTSDTASDAATDAVDRSAVTQPDLDATLDTTRIETASAPEANAPREATPAPETPERGGIANALDTSGSRAPDVEDVTPTVVTEAPRDASPQPGPSSTPTVDETPTVRLPDETPGPSPGPVDDTPTVVTSAPSPTPDRPVSGNTASTSNNAAATANSGAARPAPTASSSTAPRPANTAPPRADSTPTPGPVDETPTVRLDGNERVAPPSAGPADDTPTMITEAPQPNFTNPPTDETPTLILNQGDSLGDETARLTAPAEAAGDVTAKLDNPLAPVETRRPVATTPQGQHEALREAIAASGDLTDQQRGMFTAMTRGNRTPERAAAEAIVNGGLDAEDVLRHGVTDPDSLRKSVGDVLRDFTDSDPAEINRLVDAATARTADTLRQAGVNDTAARIAGDKVAQYGPDYATAAIGYAQDVHPSTLIDTGRFTEDGLRKGLDDYLLTERKITDAAERQRLIDDWMAPRDERRPVEFRAADGTPLDPGAPRQARDLEGAEINVKGEDGFHSSYQPGELLGEGSTSAAYRDRDNPNGVIRINHPDGHQAAGAPRAVDLADMQKAQALDDMGRKALSETTKESAYLADVRVYRSDVLPDGRRIEAVQMAPGEIAADLLDKRARDALPADRRAELDALEAIEASGGTLTQAQDDLRKAIQNEIRDLRQFTPEEAEALAGAIHELNEAGYVVLDGHVHNFSIVQESDGLRVAFLDPGGIVPVAGGDAARARAAQRRAFEYPAEYSQGISSPGLVERMYPEMARELATELEDVIDFGAFADAPVPITPETLPFRPSLGFDHPEVAAAFGAFD